MLIMLSHQCPLQIAVRLTCALCMALYRRLGKTQERLPGLRSHLGHKLCMAFLMYTQKLRLHQDSTNEIMPCRLGALLQQA